MTLLVRDEEDILEANLRYHLSKGVDFIIVTDNNSVDSTPDILARYQRMGYVRAIKEPDDDYSQWRWVTRMARMAYEEYDADWVINSDADEFWWPEEGDLKSTFAKIPDKFGAVKAPRVNFLVEEGNVKPGVSNMTLRDDDRTSYVGNTLLPKVCHRGLANVVVEQGNHGILEPKVKVWEKSEPVIIFHYPLRGYEQFENKIIKGGQAYERNTELPSNAGRGWRILYQDYYQKGRLREYYDAQCLSQTDRDDGLSKGRYAYDTRLQDHLDSLKNRFPTPRYPLRYFFKSCFPSND